MMMGGRLEANVEEDLFKVGTDTMLQYAHLLLRLVEFCVSPTQKNTPRPPSSPQDFVRPDFMQKDISEMTEEELRQASEIEKKEQAFLEEREKLKRALEAELRKLQGSIVQAMEQFDERLNKLFHLKIKTEMAVHQASLNCIGCKPHMCEHKVAIINAV